MLVSLDPLSIASCEKNIFDFYLHGKYNFMSISLGIATVDKLKIANQSSSFLF